MEKPVSTASQPAQLKPELGLRDLTLFAIAFIVGPRWIAIAAHAGPGSILLWIVAAVLFAAPLGVAVAALLQKYPGAGGLYLWTRNDFGPWHGFLAFWIYWFGIALTLPGSAMFAVSMSAYALGPTYAHLADSRVYVLVVSLSVIWIAIGTNLVGMKIGKWTENAGGIASWVLGALLVAVAALVWSRHGSATPLHLWSSSNLGTLNSSTWNWDTLGFFGAIAFALSGMEVLGLMGGEIRAPERTVVPATWIGTVFATVFYAATTVALLVLLDPPSISEMHGLADGTNVAARLFGLSWLTPLIAVLVMVSSIGGFGAFGASVSRMPYAAGVDTLLPAAFARVHPRWGVPHVSILVFGGVASVLLVTIQLGDTMRAAYQSLVSLMVLAGFIPYIYIFASAWKCGRRIAAAAGMGVTLLTLVSSVVPTPEVTNVWLFEFKLAAVTAIIIVSAWLVYRRGTPSRAPQA